MAQNRDLLHSGAIYINRIRLSLTVLYYTSVALTFHGNTTLQNTLYLSVITVMVIYGLITWLWNRKGRMPDWLSKSLVFLDVGVVTLTMVGGATEKIGAQLVLQNVILYLIMIFYIVYSAYLLSRRFTILVSIFAALCVILVSLVAVFVGQIQLTEETDLVVQPGYASFSNEILKVLFVITAGILTAIILRMSRQAMDAAEEQSRQALESLLTIQETNRRSGETAKQLEGAVQGMADFFQNFNNTVNEHATAFEEISASMEEFAASNERSAELVHNQFQRIDGLNNQSQSIKVANEGVQQNASLLQQRMTRAREASQSVNETMMQMDRVYADLMETFQKVSDVTGIMAGVSEQTNLLALNASIEAARAGEAGRGFAVVADEVSRLAETSSKNARAIADSIARSSTQMQNGKQSIQDAMQQNQIQDQQFEEAFQMFGDVLQNFSSVQETNHQIWDGLKQLRDLSSEIEVISREQKAGSSEINQSLGSLESSLNDLVERSAVIGDHLKLIQTQADALRNPD